MKSRKKSRIIDSYMKPKTVKKFVKFPYKRVRIDWIDIMTLMMMGLLLFLSVRCFQLLV